MQIIKIMSIIISKKMTIEEIDQMLAQLPSGKVFKSAKHCGVLKLNEDPLDFQKRIRDEWK